MDTNQNINLSSGIQTPAMQYNTFLFSTIDNLSGWMKFIGIYSIVLGSLYCLGIITAAFGVPIILAGKSLYNSSKSVKKLKNFNNPYVLNETLLYLNKYFKITGILTIIGIALSIIYIIVIIFIYLFLS